MPRRRARAADSVTRLDHFGQFDAPLGSKRYQFFDRT
jgi:hypothetical protein